MSVAVLGSLFTDIAATAPRRPGPGETVIGTDLVITPGGKGFNQAAAASAAGADVDLVSRVGDDLFGRDLLEACARAQVGAAHVTIDPIEGTGIGLPVVDADGENAIVVVPRAASRLSDDDAERAKQAIADAGVLLLQLEVPIAASLAAARIAAAAGTVVVLNAAPADVVPDALLAATDHLVVNEHEARALLGGTAPPAAEEAPGAAAELRRRLELTSVVITLGAAGAAWADAAGQHAIAGHHVTVVDTVGAGDAFCGYLAAGIATRTPLADAIRAANAAGALTVTRPGAQPALPTLAEVRALTATTSTTASSISMEKIR